MTDTATIERLAESMTTRMEAMQRAFEALAEVLHKDHGTTLTRPEAYAYLDVDRSTMARYEKRPDFPKRDKQGRYALVDLVKWKAGR
mgnify:FL=1